MTHLFTGIIEELGTVQGLRLLPESGQLTVEGPKVLSGTQIGDSIAVNGVCLTVTQQSDRLFTADVMAETLSKTNLAELKSGSPVNLERALQLQTRLGGHLVSGHIDGVGQISKITAQGIAHIYEISAPPDLLTFVLPKGSIAIDGISLTVVEVGADFFSVSLIPHTFGQTTLGFKKLKAKVNLETDLIGKYVARFMERNPADKSDRQTLSLSFLEENGFL